VIVIVFRSRLREGFDAAKLGALGERMYSLAASMPGFISYKDFAAQDGENLTFVEFESTETLAHWRDHPEHQEAQRQGREEFFSDYTIQVCQPLRAYTFDAAGGRRDLAI
jgi:heme-degrading monooxygenase HmoA